MVYWILFLAYPVSDTKSDEYVGYIVSCMPSSLYTVEPQWFQRMLLRGVLFSHEYINELFAIACTKVAFFYNSLPFAVCFLLPAPIDYTWQELNIATKQPRGFV